MAVIGEVHHFTEAPEIYLVEQNLHVIDRINGGVALHKVYPAAIAMQFAERISALADMAELIVRIASGPPAKVKAKKKHKR